ncbi:MAG TPA: hypothetical protein PLH94_14990 [Fimbriimonadaceae bacterium]|nr:hypothetical protein [Fimbriimonadaceae bacterium]
MRCTAVMAFLLAAAVAGTQPPWVMALSWPSMDAKDLEVLLAVAVARPQTGRSSISKPAPGSLEVSMVKFLALQSSKGNATKEFTGLIPLLWSRAVPLRATRRYLLVAVRAQDGRFRFSAGSEFATPVEIEAKPGQDCCVVLALETSAAKLPSGVTGADLVATAMLDTLDTMTHAKVDEVVRLLGTALPPQGMRQSARAPHDRPAARTTSASTKPHTRWIDP